MPNAQLTNSGSGNGLTNGVLSTGGQLVPVGTGKITGTNTTLNPASMTFNRVARLPRYFKRLSEIGKKIVSLQPAFDYNAFGDMIWTRSAFGGSPNSTWTEDGTYTTSYNAAGGYKHIFGVKPVYPYCHAECTVNPGVSSNGTYNAIALGLFLTTDGSKWLVAKYDAKTLTVSIEYNSGSGAATVPTLSTYTAATYTFGSAPPAPFLFEFTLTGRTVTVHVAGQHIMSKDIKAAIDMRNPTTGIPLYSWGFYVQSDGVGNAMSVTGSFNLGYFGAIGMTDYRLVKDKWGNPYQDAQGLVYFTSDLQGWQCTNGAVNGITGWESTHSGVFSLDPRTGDYKEVGKIFPSFVNNIENLNSNYSGFTNNQYTVPVPGGTGSLAGTNDSELIYDPENNQWTLLGLVSSIGDGTPYAMYYSQFSSENPLRGIVQPQMSIIQYVQPTDLQSAAEQSDLNASAYVDNAGLWHLFVSKQGGNPRHYTGSSLANLTRADSYVSSVYQEGCCTVRVGDRVYACFTDNNSAGLGFVYDISTGTMTQIGTVSYSPAVPGSGIMPWPTLFPYRHNGITEFYALLFSSNDYGQHYMTLGEAMPGGKVCAWTAGTPYLYKATQTISGYQSPLTFYGF